MGVVGWGGGRGLKLNFKHFQSNQIIWSLTDFGWASYDQSCKIFFLTRRSIWALRSKKSVIKYFSVVQHLLWSSNNFVSQKNVFPSLFRAGGGGRKGFRKTILYAKCCTLTHRIEFLVINLWNIIWIKLSCLLSLKYIHIHWAMPGKIVWRAGFKTVWWGWH